MCIEILNIYSASVTALSVGANECILATHAFLASPDNRALERFYLSK